jgi:NADPH:quinone reductase-like Zn-dependent oxidoreductase
VVVEKGVDVNNFEIGDEVYSRVPQEQMGTVAEFVSINSELVAKKQKIVLRRSSRITINGLTAIQALESVGIKENDRFLFMQALAV